MNKRKKGRTFELIVEKKLIKLGWKTHLVKPKRRYEPSEDIYGVFDICAVRNGVHLYGQIKHECKWVKYEIEMLHDFKVTYLHPNDKVILFNYRKGSARIKKGWELLTDKYIPISWNEL